MLYLLIILDNSLKSNWYDFFFFTFHVIDYIE